MGFREGNLGALGHGIRHRTTITTCLLMAVFFVCYTNREFLRFPVEHELSTALDDHPPNTLKLSDVQGVSTVSGDHPANSLTLSDAQCTALFPHAFDEIELALSRGPVKRSLDKITNGHVRARIYNGALYLTDRGLDVWHRQSAILHQIHRAIVTAPSPSELPNINFEFSVNDHPSGDVWSLARSDADKQVHNTWLMPDFGFWSWPEPHIGSLDEVHDRIIKTEGSMTWEEKESKAVWRGTVKWNKGLRGKLLDVAWDRPWSDVQRLNWSSNALAMEDFCRYKYLIYTEGVTYSGRLRYFQMCRSIIITPELKWHQTTSPLIRSAGPDQNIVIVKDDWSDLAETIEYLEANPEHAERVANNTVRTFRDWYLRPAVETCYWRKLFRAWAHVTPPVGQLYPEERGTRWESFILMHRLHWGKNA